MWVSSWPLSVPNEVRERKSQVPGAGVSRTVAGTPGTRLVAVSGAVGAPSVSAVSWCV